MTEKYKPENPAKTKTRSPFQNRRGIILGLHPHFRFAEISMTGERIETNPIIDAAVDRLIAELQNLGVSDDDIIGSLLGRASFFAARTVGRHELARVLDLYARLLRAEDHPTEQ
ncbi:hypothetical protein [Sinorhizobium psoraleae]|uniref:Uncharacterized protein n=1 Tax=Sinorhizobium psoraleae TaxID=520838 RepID=A0ABT4KI92_9HYPH|nr:hypothetical protein [Sinorhizobium psoraleae]MCZ4091686.1 hypothetical protein [Sinorhizobium psoraleae]